MEVKLCDSDKNCPNPNCPFRHSTPLCRYAQGCTKKGCIFRHPLQPIQVTVTSPSKIQAPKVCRFGTACTNDKCTYLHPDGKHPTSTPKKKLATGVSLASSDNGMKLEDGTKVPCRFGSSCKRVGCRYVHPISGQTDAGRETTKAVAPTSTSVTQPKPCMFGEKCFRKDCYFSHPPGRNLESMMTEMKPEDGKQVAPAIAVEGREKGEERGKDKKKDQTQKKGGWQRRWPVCVWLPPQTERDKDPKAIEAQLRKLFFKPSSSAESALLSTKDKGGIIVLTEPSPHAYLNFTRPDAAISALLHNGARLAKGGQPIRVKIAYNNKKKEKGKDTTEKDVKWMRDACRMLLQDHDLHIREANRKAKAALRELSAVYSEETQRNYDACQEERSLLLKQKEEFNQAAAAAIAQKDLLKFAREISRLKARLPILGYRSEIIATISSQRVVIIQAETGSGKTTQLVQYLVDDYLAKGKAVLCTQPRKLACLSVSNFVSQMYRNKGVSAHVGGGTVQKGKGKRERIQFMTEQVLLNKLLSAKEEDASDVLNNVDVVIVDEAHERSLNGDLLLAFLKKELANRPELRLCIASATLDATKFVTYFQDFGIKMLEIPGRLYPVTIEWDVSCANLSSAVCQRVLTIHRTMPPGDVLVFLPGKEDISDTYRQLASLEDESLLLLPLHSKLKNEEQQQVLEPAPEGQRKIILSTNVAETGITIDGVIYVVDSGKEKQKAFNSSLNMETLTLTDISQSSAKQRAGRAGRTKPGLCYRLYGQDDFITFPGSPLPEIKRTHLGSLVLRLTLIGVANLEKFDWIDPPAAKDLEAAIQLLIYLGAIQRTSKGLVITELGKNIAALEMEPRHARAMLAAIETRCSREVSIFFGLASSDPWIFREDRGKKEKGKGKETKGAQKDKDICHPDGDMLTAVKLYQEWERHVVIKAKSKAVTLSEETINKAFSSCGPITSIQMQQEGKGEKKFFSALVRFETFEAARRAAETKQVKGLMVFTYPRAWCTKTNANSTAFLSAQKYVEETEKKVLQYLLRRSRRDTSSTMTTTDYSADNSVAIRKAILCGFFANLGVANGTRLSDGYFLPASGLIGKVQRSSALHSGPHRSAPSWIIFFSCIQTEFNTHLCHVMPIEPDWIVDAAPYFPFGQDEVIRNRPTKLEITNIGPAVIRQLSGKPLAKLQLRLKASITIDRDTNSLCVFAPVHRSKEVLEIVKEEIETIRENISEEAVLVRYVGSTRLVMKAGAEARNVLLLGQFDRVLVHLPPGVHPTAEYVKQMFGLDAKSVHSTDVYQDPSVSHDRWFAKVIFYDATTAAEALENWHAKEKDKEKNSGWMGTKVFPVMDRPEAATELQGCTFRIHSKDGEITDEAVKQMLSKIGQIKFFSGFKRGRTKGMEAYCVMSTPEQAQLAISEFASHPTWKQTYADMVYSLVIKIQSAVYNTLSDSIKSTLAKISKESKHIRLKTIEKPRYVLIQITQLVGGDKEERNRAQERIQQLILPTIIPIPKSEKVQVLRNGSAAALAASLKKECNVFIHTDKTARKISIYGTQSARGTAEEAIRRFFEERARESSMSSIEISLPSGEDLSASSSYHRMLETTGVSWEKTSDPTKIRIIGPPECVAEALSMLDRHRVNASISEKGNEKLKSQKGCSCCKTSSGSLVHLEACGHSYCSECIERIATEGHIPIGCVLCQQPITWSTLSRCLSAEALDELVHESVKKWCTENAASYTFCPTAGCEQVLAADQAIHHCDTCMTSYCMRCAVEYHEGWTCEEYTTWKLKDECKIEDTTLGYSISSIPPSNRTYRKYEELFRNSWNLPQFIYSIKAIFNVWNSNVMKGWYAYRREIVEKGHDANERMLWHGTGMKCESLNDLAHCGSADCGVCNICAHGFKVRSKPDAKNMFGDGLYFAPNASKSHYYARGTQREGSQALLLCRVICGNSKHFSKAAPHLKEPPEGYDSVYGKPRSEGGASLLNPEYVVYNERAAVPVAIVWYTFEDISPQVSVAEKKLAIAALKAALQQKQYGREVDICFLMDCTGSMGGWIQAAKEQVIGIMKKFTEAYEMQLNMSFIAYRDYCDGSNQYQIHHFTKDGDELKNWIGGLCATGGGDAPESVLGALNLCLALQWQGACRRAFLIGDCPCHGKRFHDMYDSLPDGEPDLTAEKVLGQMKAMDIDLTVIEITQYTAKMVQVFSEIWNSMQGNASIMTIKLGSDVSLFERTVLNSIELSISARASSLLSKEEKEKEEKETTIVLCSDPPDWTSGSDKRWGPWLNCEAYSLTRKQNQSDLATNHSLQLVSLKKPPFAEGGMRIAYYLRDRYSGRKLVAKEYKDPKLKGAANHFADMKMQAWANILADEYNKLDVVPTPIQFVATQLYRFPDGSCFSVEQYIDGEYRKYNNNIGWTAEDQENIQAFSHFTWAHTNGDMLVVDLQGVNNILTDPQIHSESHLADFGQGNLGDEGIRQFFLTHTCSELCRHLGLKRHPAQKDSAATALIMKPKVVVKGDRTLLSYICLCGSQFTMTPEVAKQEIRKSGASNLLCDPCKKKMIPVDKVCYVCQASFNFYPYYFELRHQEPPSTCDSCQNKKRYPKHKKSKQEKKDK